MRLHQHARASGPRLVRAIAALAVTVALLATAACHSDPTPTKGATVSDTSEPQRLESALTRKVQAEHLIEQVAHAVSPGSKPRPSGAGSDYGPSECTAPLTGQVYYTISRQFDAPSGKTGADLVPALRAAFENHGMQTENQETVGDHIGFTGGTDFIGFNVLAYNTSRLVQINLDTECGSPESSTP